MEDIKCAGCGKIIVPGNGPNGLPNGLGFQLKDGRVINVCADCIVAMARKQILKGSGQP